MAENYDQGDLASRDPNSPVHDVGSGSGFGASLYYLYKAGQIEMPSIAQRYFEMSQLAHSAASGAQSNAAPVGNPGALTGLADVLDDLHYALNTTVTSVRDCGVVLSQAAKRYAATDQDVADAFNDRLKDIDNDADFKGKAPTVSDPPAVDSPLPNVTPPSEAPPLDDWTPPEAPPEAELPDDPGSGSSGGSTD